MRDCPQNPANELRALVDTGELCEARFGEGDVGLDLIQDGSTRIVANDEVRAMLKREGFRWRPSAQGWFRVRGADGASVLDLVRTGVIEVISGGDDASRVCVRDGLGLIAGTVDHRLRAAGFASEHDGGAMCGPVLDSAALREAVEQGQRMRGAVEVLMAEHAEREARVFVDFVTRRFHQRDLERPRWVGMPLKRRSQRAAGVR